MPDSPAIDLRRLALACEISNYDVVFWLNECELKADVLLVPNPSVGRFIANCWGAQMRAHIPALRIVVKPQVEKPAGARPSILNARGRKWEQERQATQARMRGLDDD